MHMHGGLCDREEAGLQMHKRVGPWEKVEGGLHTHANRTTGKGGEGPAYACKWDRGTKQRWGSAPANLGPWDNEDEGLPACLQIWGAKGEEASQRACEEALCLGILSKAAQA